MKSYPSNIRLEGHADERGTREYNMALGERRANSVKEFMVLQGVPSSMIEVISYGEERAASFGSNSAAWSMNRRVELK
jgi:peptidoglycan-associated lipoprotein